MITVDTFAKIEKQVNEVFADVKVKNSFEPTGIKLAFTVTGFNKFQLNRMYHIVNENDLEINLKRSGTGISVHLN